MADPSSSDAGSLSERARAILARADAQLAGLRDGAPDEEASASLAERTAAPSPPAPPQAPGPVDFEQLLDTVEAGIAAARAHLVTLAASLERVAQELGLPAPALEPDAEPPAPAAPPEAVAEPPAEPSAPAAQTNAAHDAARLVAIEMAVAGETREGIQSRLRQGFGIEDPASILDDVFGPARGARPSGYGA